MKRVYSLCLSAALLVLANNALAEKLKCVGQDVNGKEVNVIVNVESGNIIVDGKVEKIISDTKGGKGIATEDYKADDGRKVYDSVNINDDNTITLNQYESKGDKFISAVELDCVKE